jgi:hypothetical protein
MKNLIIGMGDVGRSLFEVFKPHHESFIRDIETPAITIDRIEALHICFPYTDDFVKAVKDYKTEYRPKLTLIHSTVLPGTTSLCGFGVVYSPVRGSHPNLTRDILAYPKYVAGPDRRENPVTLAKEFMAACGINVRIVQDVQTLELIKIVSNVHMGLEIAWRQEVGRMIKQVDGDAALYDDWEDDYNEMYAKLNQRHLIRPRMSAKPIGGHCILPCTEMLAKVYDTLALDFLFASNEEAKEEQLCPATTA